MTDGAALLVPDDGSALEVLPGYYVEQSTGAWLTCPRPEVPPMTLGWQVIDWAELNLVHPLTGDPWTFTKSQERFLALWYAVDARGRWLYRSGVKRGAKGTGKDPFAAAMCLCELAGPVKLDGIVRGVPQGVPHRMALVQIAANSEDQAKDLLRVANAMVSLQLSEAIDYDPGIKASMAGGRSRMEVLTRAEGSNEGDPATFLVLNESHHMTAASGGQALAKVGRRNVGKSPGGQARACEFTNAHLPGGESVAEDSFGAWQKQVMGETTRVDILYDSREAAPHLRLHLPEELALGISQAYADAPWVDQERIAAEAEDPRTPLADSVRFYFNSLPTNEFAWVDPRRWDERAQQQKLVDDGEAITLFLDCSKSDDSTALMGCRISDGHWITLGMWQRPHGAPATWQVPREDVDASVREAFARYDVQMYGCDPSPARDDDTEALYWADLMDAWHRDFKDTVLLWAIPNRQAVQFDMRMSVTGGRERMRLLTEQAELIAQQVQERNPAFSHDGNAALRLHAIQARRRLNEWGTWISKVSADSSAKVDLAVAGVGAALLRRLVLNSGKTRRKRTGRVW